MADKTVVVTVQHGSLKGRKVTAKTGTKYFSFQGVPYAKPPVGPLRFKDPQPLDPWTGERDALTEGSLAPQMDMITNEYDGVEDCLFLNVYTPQLPDGKSNPKKPVMVWIHGGGFSKGSGNSNIYGPDYIISEDVVLVTINYRLGALGFLSLQNADVPGNAGMKDQVAALRWVKKNIDKFGGDAGNVTIFGESAGGASVHFQILSPMAKGLFKRAIAQSGSTLNPWAFIEGSVSRDRAFKLGELLGCPTDDEQKLVEFLRTVPERKLVEAQELVPPPEEKYGGSGIAFVITRDWQSGEAGEVFLPGKPLDLIQAGKFHHVPLIAGVTSHEGFLLLKDVVAKPSLLQDIDKHFELLLPLDLQVERKSGKARDIADEVKKFYFGDEAVSQNTILQYADLQTDTCFVNKINKTVKLHAQFSNAPVYYYEFVYDGAFGVIKKMCGADRLPGVCHGDELGYLFHISLIKDAPGKDSQEMKVLHKMVRMWTNFAKTGNPTSSLDGVVDTSWAPVTTKKVNYLSIGPELRMKEDLRKEKMAFWEKLYNETSK